MIRELFNPHFEYTAHNNEFFCFDKLIVASAALFRFVRRRYVSQSIAHLIVQSLGKSSINLRRYQARRHLITIESSKRVENMLFIYSIHFLNGRRYSMRDCPKVHETDLFTRSVNWFWLLTCIAHAKSSSNLSSPIMVTFVFNVAIACITHPCLHQTDRTISQLVW